MSPATASVVPLRDPVKAKSVFLSGDYLPLLEIRLLLPALYHWDAG